LVIESVAASDVNLGIALSMACGKMVATGVSRMVIGRPMARSKMVHAGVPVLGIKTLLACVKIDPDGGR